MILKTLFGIFFIVLFFFNIFATAQPVPVAIEKLFDDIKKNLNIGHHIKQSKQDVIALIRNSPHREISDSVKSSLTDDELVEYTANRADFYLICAAEMVLRESNNNFEEHPDCKKMEQWMTRVKIEVKDDMTDFLRIFAQRKPPFVSMVHNLVTSRFWESLLDKIYFRIDLLPREFGEEIYNIVNCDEIYAFLLIGVVGYVCHTNGQATLLMADNLWAGMNTPSIRPGQANF